MLYRLLLPLALSLALALPATAQDYLPAYERDPHFNIGSGTELVLVYFGGSTCGPCQADEFKAALDRAKVLLAERAEQEGKAFAAIGVAVDQSVEDGLAFLNASGRFDELAVGRNWFNSASLAHLWRPEGLAKRRVGLPSVVVFEREMSMGKNITASEPRYLVELGGGVAIPEWVEAGAPLE
ncbi:MAG: TlpA family protein disulfide reductase [Rhodothermales bacterium]